ncbi:MAG: methyl-accepting chemotaxis protein [Rhodocyclaceae bacterium]
MLRSREMALSPKELKWLPFFGKTGKLAMRWGTFLSRSRYARLEIAFEGFATTRVRLMQGWADHIWQVLAQTSEEVTAAWPEVDRGALADRLAALRDASEIFVVDTAGRVIESTTASRKGAASAKGDALRAGLRARFLHGPYVDEVTAKLPPSSSRFHDAVTLMFYQPIVINGTAVGALCARVPNDVVGDLIQREAGHIFHESGDNYLFMVDSRFDPSIVRGTALSRSRFEDNTFSLGDNLKDGVRTAFGTVKVQRHTEFELVFNDPATGQLHPGVRETIARGSNLFVTYPGYSDYRHIPVVGKGVTFQMPGSPDTWGMMCEADLEEVYRFRGISYQLQRLYIVTSLVAWGVAQAAQLAFSLNPGISAATEALFLVAGMLVFRQLGARPVSKRMLSLNAVLQGIAEGGGNLSERLPRAEGRRDETTIMAQWVNSFIDNIDQIISKVIRTSHDIDRTNATLGQSSAVSATASEDMSVQMRSALDSIHGQIDEIEQAGSEAEAMRGAVDAATAEARQQFELIRVRSDSIRNSVGLATRSIRDLEVSAQEIGRIVTVIKDIAGQTNLLALNAAIEAARAGEDGRGFAVVADEVRKLAERTAVSTKEIEAMVGAVQGRAEDAVNTMETGMAELEEGLQLATAAATDRADVQHILQRLFATIDQISTAAHDNGRRVEEVAGSAEAVRRAIDEAARGAQLTGNAARTLDQLVGQFKVSGH